VLELRQEFGWGKDKLVVLLRRQSVMVSTSMVGRILCYAKRRGLLREPPRRPVSASRRRALRPYGTRKPKGYGAQAPGDLVQVDTLDLRPLPGVVRKQFTARDVVCRWDVVEVYSRATSRTTTDFLGGLRRRAPFQVKAIQVDGGSEFMADFEEACREAGIRLFVLPPRSPKLNGHVERAQETHTEEFWERYDGDLDLASARQALRHWERIYNTIRPHQSLAWRTPAKYLRECHPEAAPGSPSVSYVVNEDSLLTLTVVFQDMRDTRARWGRRSRAYSIGAV
jgi:transposase InsO family protein